MASIKRNFFYNSILSLSRVLFPLISFPYSSRILGPNGIGKVNFVDGYSQYFVLLAALGIPIYGVREVAKVRNSPALLSRLTSELVVLNFLAMGICGLLYFLIALLTGKYFTYEGLFILGSIYLFLSVFLAEWFFQGMEQFKYVSIRSFLLNMSSLVLLFLLVKKQNDILWYYGINVIVLVGNVVVNVYMLLKETDLSFRGLKLRRHLKPLILLFSSQVAISVYVLLDKVILGYMAKDINVGYYSAALKVTKILLSLISALAIVMMPQMTKAFHLRDADKIRSLYNKSNNFVFTVGIPISIGLICLSDEIILLLSGRDFMPASESLKLIAPTVFLIGLSNIFGMQILTANGKERILFRCVVAGTILNVGSNLLLIPYFKHNGTSVSILITELFVTVITGYYACREIGVGFNWRQLFINGIICIPFWIIHYLFTFKELFLTVSCTILGSVTYYFILQVFVLKNDLWLGNYLKIRKMLFK